MPPAPAVEGSEQIDCGLTAVSYVVVKFSIIAVAIPAVPSTLITNTLPAWPIVAREGRADADGWMSIER
jgi:hypothetical protein